jgi:hypothetical protein
VGLKKLPEDAACWHLAWFGSFHHKAQEELQRNRYSQSEMQKTGCSTPDVQWHGHFLSHIVRIPEAVKMQKPQTVGFSSHIVQGIAWRGPESIPG